MVLIDTKSREIIPKRGLKTLSKGFSVVQMVNFVSKPTVKHMIYGLNIYVFAVFGAKTAQFCLYCRL